jgi:hypothetical protein
MSLMHLELSFACAVRDESISFFFFSKMVAFLIAPFIE